MKERKLMSAFCDLAFGVAEASTCERAKHGSVLTTMDLQVISYGYNGVAKGLPNGCLRGEQGNCGCVHAEANAVAKAGDSSLDKIAFITCQPCERCASLLVNNGVRMVVQKNGHRDYPDGILILERLGIPYGDVNEMAGLLRESTKYVEQHRQGEAATAAEYIKARSQADTRRQAETDSGERRVEINSVSAFRRIFGLRHSS